MPDALVEDVFHPARIQWLALHTTMLDAETKADLYRALSQAVARYKTSSAAFLRECLQTLAHLGSRMDDDLLPVFSATPSLCLHPALITWNATKKCAVESLIRSGCAQPHDYRLYADYHTYTNAREYEWQIIPTHTIKYSNTAMLRLKQIVSKFAKETTFKVHADAGLHAEIITSVMAPFLSAGLIREETPYQIAASVLGENVNDIVRPLLSTAVRDRVDSVNWDGPFTMGSIIVSSCILFELVGVRTVGLITNATFCKGRSDLPLLFVTRTQDGDPVVGLRKEHKYSTFLPDARVADILLKWVIDCEPYNVPQIEQLHKVLFTDDIENSPLVKFIR